MKYIITLAALILFLSACGKNSLVNYDLLPECLKEEIDNPDINITKIGIPKEDNTKFDNLYWVFYNEAKFGKQVNEFCSDSLCYGLCGLTTQEEVDAIFDSNWTTVWQD